MTDNNFLRRYKAGISCIILFLLSVLMIFITSGTLSFNPKSLGVSFFSSIQKAVALTTGFFTNTFNSISELRNLQEEHQQLQKELNRFRTLQRDYTGLQEENRLLRQQLNFSQSVEYTLVSAQAIGKDPSDYFSGITIDRGSRDGVTVNAAVIAYADGFQGLVGRIAEVAPNFSKIVPIYERESYVASRLQKSRYEGLIEGKGSRSHDLLMKYVIKRAKEEISFGDIIITSGMNSLYPENLYIGRVREIRSQDWNPDIELLVEPFVDFERLEYLYVVKGTKDAE